MDGLNPALNNPGVMSFCGISRPRVILSTPIIRLREDLVGDCEFPYVAAGSHAEQNLRFFATITTCLCGT